MGKRSDWRQWTKGKRSKPMPEWWGKRSKRQKPVKPKPEAPRDSWVRKPVPAPPVVTVQPVRLCAGVAVLNFDGACCPNPGAARKLVQALKGKRADGADVPASNVYGFLRGETTINSGDLGLIFDALGLGISGPSAGKKRR